MENCEYFNTSFLDHSKCFDCKLKHVTGNKKDENMHDKLHQFNIDKTEIDCIDDEMHTKHLCKSIYNENKYLHEQNTLDKCKITHLQLVLDEYVKNINSNFKIILSLIFILFIFGIIIIALLSIIVVHYYI